MVPLLGGAQALELQTCHVGIRPSRIRSNQFHCPSVRAPFYDSHVVVPISVCRRIRLSAQFYQREWSLDGTGNARYSQNVNPSRSELLNNLLRRR